MKGTKTKARNKNLKFSCLGHNDPNDFFLNFFDLCTVDKGLSNLFLGVIFFFHSFIHSATFFYPLRY